MDERPISDAGFDEAGLKAARQRFSAWRLARKQPKNDIKFVSGGKKSVKVHVLK